MYVQYALLYFAISPIDILSNFCEISAVVFRYLCLKLWIKPKRVHSVQIRFNEGITKRRLAGRIQAVVHCKRRASGVPQFFNPPPPPGFACQKLAHNMFAKWK